MRPGARKLSILVSKSSGVTAAEMLKLLPALRLSAARYVENFKRFKRDLHRQD